MRQARPDQTNPGQTKLNLNGIVSHDAFSNSPPIVFILCRFYFFYLLCNTVHTVSFKVFFVCFFHLSYSYFIRLLFRYARHTMCILLHVQCTNVQCTDHDGTHNKKDHENLTYGCMCMSGTCRTREIENWCVRWLN